MESVKTKIAIIEDDGTLAFMIDELCTSAGHEVVGCVATAAEAEELVRESRPDVLILDFNLEGERNGLELIGDLKEDFPDMRSVLVTGWDINDIASRMDGAQPDRILRKPVRPAVLMEVIDQTRAARDLPQEKAAGPSPAEGFASPGRSH